MPPPPCRDGPSPAIMCPMSSLAAVHDPLRTERMTRWATWLCTVPSDRDPPTVVQLCRELGVSERTLFNWRYEPEFHSLIEPLILRTAKRDLPEVVAMLGERAKSGSIEHIRLFLELIKAYGFQPRGSEPERAPIQIQILGTPVLAAAETRVLEVAPEGIVCQARTGLPE